jgi:hypothetical protein
LGALSGLDYKNLFRKILRLDALSGPVFVWLENASVLFAVP